VGLAAERLGAVPGAAAADRAEHRAFLAARHLLWRQRHDPGNEHRVRTWNPGSLATRGRRNSVTLNLGQAPDEPWPIYVERDAGTYEARLAPGDALLYRGCDCFHWREPYEGTRLAQAFLHYVDRNGPHAAEKFDRRRTLMRPKPEAAAGNQAQSE